MHKYILFRNIIIVNSLSDQINSGCLINIIDIIKEKFNPKNIFINILKF